MKTGDWQLPWTWLRWAPWRALMRLSHRYHWHHTRTIHPDSDTMEVCDWCGGRWVTFYGGSNAPGGSWLAGANERMVAKVAADQGLL